MWITFRGMSVGCGSVGSGAAFGLETGLRSLVPRSLSRRGERSSADVETEAQPTWGSEPSRLGGWSPADLGVGAQPTWGEEPGRRVERRRGAARRLEGAPATEAPTSRETGCVSKGTTSGAHPGWSVGNRASVARSSLPQPTWGEGSRREERCPAHVRRGGRSTWGEGSRRWERGPVDVGSSRRGEKSTRGEVDVGRSRRGEKSTRGEVDAGRRKPTWGQAQPAGQVRLVPAAGLTGPTGVPGLTAERKPARPTRAGTGLRGRAPGAR
ncbi:hypothetical protein SAMN04489834_2937 [Microterricola viridarii]|uniref:Uncharacterized protein n=1 Tax=Microterricola viridarii TaxID=412690 RepID=A0A1H1Y052_9MICO|nr:hypothetical protein SAMN04489834_2937 [Microterricola viridarii]